ncbi:MAG: PilZ domain-containing protein [Thermodesulfovibrionales bacterium]|nr:PilZ domain-containing protein [Thermodesulfovibrionales bacterium]
MDRERGYQRHRRFTKRLEVTFRSGAFTHRGILSNLSMNGLFIKTNRGFAPGTTVDIELVLPDNQISRMKGIVRRTIKTVVYPTKNGMGVELTQKDDQFIRYAESFLREHPSQASDSPVPPPFPDDPSSPPDFQLLLCPGCGVKNKVSTEKLHLGPKCGKCGSPLLSDMP